MQLRSDIIWQNNNNSKKTLSTKLKSETSNIRVRDRVSNTFMGHHILNRYSYQINPQTKY